MSIITNPSMQEVRSAMYDYTITGLLQQGALLIFNAKKGYPSPAYPTRKHVLKYDTPYMVMHNYATDTIFLIKACECDANTMNAQYNLSKKPFLTRYCGTQLVPLWVISKLAVVYRHLIERLSNKFATDYKDYGALGIYTEYVFQNYGEMAFTKFVDDLWESYVKAIEDNPGVKISIDRIDGRYGYFKDNIQWSTPEMQEQNKLYNYETIIITEERKAYVVDDYRKWAKMHNENQSDIKKSIMLQQPTPNGTIATANHGLFHFMTDKIDK